MKGKKTGGRPRDIDDPVKISVAIEQHVKDFYFNYAKTFGNYATDLFRIAIYEWQEKHENDLPSNGSAKKGT